MIEPTKQQFDFIGKWHHARNESKFFEPTHKNQSWRVLVRKDGQIFQEEIKSGKRTRRKMATPLIT